MGYKELIVVLLMAITISQTIGYEDEARRSAKFSFDFYKAMFDQNENTIVSPFSFRVLLSVLYQSVTGTSETELHDKLYLGEKEETFNSQRQSLTRFGTSPNLKIVNKMFLKKDGSLKPNFLAIVEGLQAKIEQVDFSQSSATANKMNSWVEEQTNGLIKNLVSSDSVTPDTALFLINTLYFKAQWKTTFARSSVHKFSFTGIDGVSRNIDMMFDHGDYRVAHLQQNHVSVLEIPYTEGSNFSFWVLLPDENSNIEQLKNSLSYNLIEQITQSFVTETYDIGLPRFEVESSVDGVETLNKLGIHSIFTKYESDMLTNNRLLRVDEIKQKSKIIVNTDGTEVATGAYYKSVPERIWPRFTANRPFIYLILTTDTLEPVFIGHFSKP